MDTATLYIHDVAAMARPEPFDERLQAIAEWLLAVQARLLSFDGTLRGWTEGPQRELAMSSSVGAAALARLCELHEDVARRVAGVAAALSKEVIQHDDIEVVGALQTDETFERSVAELIELLARESARNQERRQQAAMARQQAEDNARREVQEILARSHAAQSARIAEQRDRARRLALDNARRQDEAVRTEVAEMARWKPESPARWLGRWLGGWLHRGNLWRASPRDQKLFVIGIGLIILALLVVVVVSTIVGSSYSSSTTTETRAVQPVVDAERTKRTSDPRPPPTFTAAPTPSKTAPIPAKSVPTSTDVTFGPGPFESR